jgi:very-short-patch-repair endonuclease
MRRNTAFARQLRQEQTDAEEALWTRLRNRALGPKFRRQVPLGGYVIDLWCAEAHLAVEVDGAGHLDPEQAAHDAARSAALAERGVRVVRFTNTEVLTNTAAVVQSIADVLAELGCPTVARDEEGS